MEKEPKLLLISNIKTLPVPEKQEASKRKTQDFGFITRLWSIFDAECISIPEHQKLANNAVREPKYKFF
jgi:hypothetical protein